MPVQISYPGVYVEEIAGGQPVVAGVSTSSTAFVDFFSRGPMDEPTRVTDMDSVERTFGGLDTRSESSYGLRQFFLNGGQEAWIVRTARAGTALAARQDVKVITPGLEARFTAANQDFQLARTAATEALAASEAAAAALTKLTEKLTDQQQEQETDKLRDQSDAAAAATNRAADATRAAAVQAQASSDELAIAIADAKAASGPVADRTVKAAEQASAGAAGARDAAEATKNITSVAIVAETLASAALKAGQKARNAKAIAEAIGALLGAVQNVQAAQVAVATQKSIIDKATSDSAAGIAVKEAAQSAQTASAQALLAAQKALAVAQLANTMQPEPAEGADPPKPVVDVKAAQALIDSAKEAGRDARRATFAANNSESVAEAKAAITQVESVASSAVTVAAGAAGSTDLTALGVAQKTIKVALAFAAASADEAADLAAPAASAAPTTPPAAPTTPPAEATTPPLEAVANSVAGAAVDSIDTAVDAAFDAVLASKSGAADAQVAAAQVGSAGPTLAARSAEAGSDQAEDATTRAAANADVVKQQIAKANKTASEAAAPAREAALASVPTKALSAADAKDSAKLIAWLQPQAKTTLDASQAAANAADGALATATSVESAAVAVATVAVQAANAADIAAEAAEAAVQANREASMKPVLSVEAINPGLWGDSLVLEIKTTGSDFALSITEYVSSGGITRRLAAESYPRVTLDWESAANALAVINDASKLIRLRYTGPKVQGAYPDNVKGMLNGGNDGVLATADEMAKGMHTLDRIEPAIFNILCLPATANMSDAEARVAISAAKVYAGKKRAFFIVDIPARIETPEDMLDWSASYRDATAFTMASYFPRLIIPDPLQEYRPRNIGSSGTVAGIYARTDTNVGVWKAPAGVNATIEGADVAVRLNDDQNGLLNPLGINVLRAFPIYGNIVWGARTLAGADQISSEWKYVPVRRLMNYVEESVFQSLKWAVFEPNNELLWSKIRVQISGFLGGLFADGAFQGAAPPAAYFVRCDGTTTTPLDIDLGVVNVQIGIAPVKPAEFVVLQFQQIAGQSAA